ncbi:CidA/LrgA family protein [Nocardioides sp. Y6]|uniref:CidA/LrgA family protein n=1 Tax=Nocardioides malaquae TaxID=2773426 RepID=A0ABR9RVH3_9ACTN|nr:CidA/LrgA family protein [Nocardioides malaquae]MBE7325601.1 CidA/LrgA family protein [Nocardioides malaquae]
MIRGLTVLLLLQVVGEIVVDVTGLPVPGPVVGMVLLFGWLQWRRPAADAGTMRAADGLLRHLQLLFVPAGVGIVTHLAVLRTEAVPLGVSLVVSWLAGLAVVGWIVQGFGRHHPEPGGDATAAGGRDA